MIKKFGSNFHCRRPSGKNWESKQILKNGRSRCRRTTTTRRGRKKEKEREKEEEEEEVCVL